MKTGIAPYSSLRRFVTTGISSSGTSRPGHPYHWKVVDLDSPLRPLTRPPEDMEKSYLPSSERLMVMGSRLETSSSLASLLLGLSSREGIAAGYPEAGKAEGLEGGGRGMSQSGGIATSGLEETDGGTPAAEEGQIRDCRQRPLTPLVDGSMQRNEERGEEEGLETGQNLPRERRHWTVVGTSKDNQGVNGLEGAEEEGAGDGGE